MNIVGLAVLLIAASPSFEMKMLDGKAVVGAPIGLTTDRLTVDTPGGPVAIEVERLLSISTTRKESNPSKSPAVIVELTDGSEIFARQYTVQKNVAHITLSTGIVLESPTGVVRAVKLGQDSGSPAAEWKRLAGMKTDGDLLAVRNGETIDYHKGILHEITPEVVHFEFDGELLPVKRSKIVGFAYHHAEAEFPPAVCRITDVSASQWPAKTLKLGERFEWTTPAGMNVSQPAERIVRVDFSAGKIVYLSDMAPESVRWTPYFDTGKRVAAVERYHAPRFDRNYDSGPLRLGGEEYAKGLAACARTEIAYRLGGQFRRFRATAGIDDALRPGGKARLIIRGDDKTLLEVFVTGLEPPRAVDIDVAGVRRLTVIVDFAQSPGAGDSLLLGDARLSK